MVLIRLIVGHLMFLMHNTELKLEDVKEYLKRPKNKVVISDSLQHNESNRSHSRT